MEPVPLKSNAVPIARIADRHRSIRKEFEGLCPVMADMPLRACANVLLRRVCVDNGQRGEAKNAGNLREPMQ
ncbi:hypothetical protein [Burkholderia anthina]|uniref:hypothetical protein n=1 Tax=Burkholderia anthina TaxID=179879 RepID=UPI001589CE9A|nr:hypothetical protein [Burkholderia anthina]